jgi:hypothetical protein
VWTGEEVVVVGGWRFLCPPGADCATPDDPPFTDGAAYDPDRRAWRPIAPAPTGFSGVAGVAHGGDVYVLLPQTGVLRYRPGDDRWDVLPAPPEPGYRNLVSAGADLVAYAPSDEGGDQRDWRLDAASGAWSPLPDDPLPGTYDRQLAWDGDALVLVATSRFPPQGPRPVAAARLPAGAGRWEPLPETTATGYHAWPIDGRVVVNPHFAREGGAVLDPRAGAWRPLPSPPDDPEWIGDLAGAVGREDAAYVYGSGWVLDLAGESWLRVPPAGGRWSSDGAVTAVDRRLFAFGGQRWAGRDGELLREAWLWSPP